MGFLGGGAKPNKQDPVVYDTLWNESTSCGGTNNLFQRCVVCSFQKDLIILNEITGVMGVDALASSHPLSSKEEDVMTPADISQLFDSITYSKVQCTWLDPSVLSTQAYRLRNFVLQSCDLMILHIWTYRPRFPFIYHKWSHNTLRQIRRSNKITNKNNHCAYKWNATEYLNKLSLTLSPSSDTQ